MHHGLVTFRSIFVVPFPVNAPAISIRYFAFLIFRIRWPNSVFVHVFSFDTWWLQFYFVRVFVVDDLHLRALARRKKSKTKNYFFVLAIETVNQITPHLGDLESISSSSSLLSKYSCLATLLYSVPLESPLLSFRFISRDSFRPAFMSCEHVWKNNNIKTSLESLF